MTIRTGHSGSRRPTATAAGRSATATGCTSGWRVVTEGEPQPIEDHDALQWLARTDLYAVGWLPADLPIVRALERLMVGSTPNP